MSPRKLQHSYQFVSPVNQCPRGLWFTACPTKWVDKSFWMFSRYGSLVLMYGIVFAEHVSNLLHLLLLFSSYVKTGCFMALWVVTGIRQGTESDSNSPSVDTYAAQSQDYNPYLVCSKSQPSSAWESILNCIILGQRGQHFISVLWPFPRHLTRIWATGALVQLFGSRLVTRSYWLWRRGHR